ncbi:hypothetical protein [Mycolicibacterium stellerae]|uniref:hypothetical protein n=1 Tax=Mycolicibacterium stellerae TaxID=2358193 RepID=UPI0013DE2C72|nr:hypothetical protein [Mycolicibacterium stellerae]
MTVSYDDDSAANVAQAAYFRVELHAQRRLLLHEIGKRQALIDRPSDAARRQRASVHSAEAELRHLDRLIGRLDNRFPAGDS